ncbi:hypothetical protein [Sediminispirochaeta bajacaliforniensis]|uniref:hypothetical protein n=1 Tax=Sediminispirochaeta bajacaliforniensis TaxID=148 RepID=UPI000366DF24|nr:hypothetical protein [Sediminispirochaeta bajacaliforniensis]
MIDYEQLLISAQPLILSASGWRKIFAATGEEEDSSPRLLPEDKALVAVMIAAFCRFLADEGFSPTATTIAVASDSRPTGPAIMEQVVACLDTTGYSVAVVGISAAPEVMAWAKEDSQVDAFVYISASHNPIGHNGIKFGLATGGVLDGEQASRLILFFKQLLDDREQTLSAIVRSESRDEERVRSLLATASFFKKQALDCYHRFLRRTVTGSSGDQEANKIFNLFASQADIYPVGVLGELNGSARALSIDKKILSEAGASLFFAGDKVGVIEHRIVPEGESLDPARKLLQKLHAQRAEFAIAYVPDNDGDRGNLVFAENDGKCRALEAQEVFALAVLSELAYTRWLEAKASDGPPSTKLAVVVNGPTSMRIDSIADAFGAETFRAEVGEANAVNLAREKRKEGYTIPILGEGSNGGNITHPSAVRDPLCTVFAVLKLLLIRDMDEKPGLFRRWLRASGRQELYREDFTLSDIIASLPTYTTTSAYEKRAILRLGNFDHGALKKAWEKEFVSQWETRKQELAERFGIVAWEERQYEATCERKTRGEAGRSGKMTGGLKVVFFGADGLVSDYIWMRGSGTEPLFRILADCKGDDKEREEYLLTWQRSMILRAYEGIR